ncbi:MAG: hotdog domain-containing protein [Acidimicrobiales bacterium]
MDEQRPVTATRRLVVSDADTALALGSGDVAVLGTPRVVALLEEAAVAAVGGSLEPTDTTVGTQISIEHLAPSPIGSEIDATAELVSAEGRLYRFEVQAVMGDTVVARGTHTRVRVRREGFGQPRDGA